MNVTQKRLRDLMLDRIKEAQTQNQGPKGVWDIDPSVRKATDRDRIRRLQMALRNSGLPGIINPIAPEDDYETH
jgi:hypothetical protein